MMKISWFAKSEQNYVEKLSCSALLISIFRLDMPTETKPKFYLFSQFSNYSYFFEALTLNFSKPFIVLIMADLRLIKVPFSEKDKAKALGARWHHTSKSWYVPQGKNIKNFKLIGLP